MGWSLAIETSQGAGGLALRDAGGTVHSVALTSRSGLDDQLMPQLNQLAVAADCAPADLELVGVSIGPGGFTGLRIATATAQMLAEATGCVLVQVPTAVVCVQASGINAGRVGVALASKQDTCWLTVVDAATMTISAPAGLADAHAAAEQLQGCTTLLADEHLPGPITDAAQALGLEFREPVCCAEACLWLTEALYAAHEHISPECLVPLYPRAPEAVALFDAREKAPKG